MCVGVTLSDYRYTCLHTILMPVNIICDPLVLIHGVCTAAATITLLPNKVWGFNKKLDRLQITQSVYSYCLWVDDKTQFCVVKPILI